MLQCQHRDGEPAIVSHNGDRYGNYTNDRALLRQALLDKTSQQALTWTVIQIRDGLRAIAERINSQERYRLHRSQVTRYVKLGLREASPGWPPPVMLIDSGQRAQPSQLQFTRTLYPLQACRKRMTSDASDLAMSAASNLTSPAPKI